MSRDRCLLPLRFHLFGRFRMAGQQTPESPRRPPRRMLEVLCYLLLVPPKAHHREQLADLLWGETDSRGYVKILEEGSWVKTMTIMP